MSSPPPTRTKPSLIWIVVVFAAAFTALVLSWSAQYGRLLFEVDYEDIISFLDALRRYHDFGNGGVIGFVRGYLESPPHAPFHSLLAAGSFALLGVRDIAPYLANFLIVLGWFGAAAYACGAARLTAWKLVVVLVFVAGFPLTFLTVHDYRPDYPAAVFTVWGVLLLVRWDPFRERPWKCWIAGLAFAMALLSKPTVFPYTLAMGGVAWTLCLWLACQRRSGLRTLPEAAFRTWPFFLTNAIVALPHFIIAAPTLLAYIYRNQLGTDKASWSLKGSFFENSFYHFLGYSGDFQMGLQKWLLLAVVLIGGGFGCFLAGWRARLGSRNWFALAAAAALAFLGVAINHHDNPYFGLVFQMLFVLLALLVLLSAWERLADVGAPWKRRVGVGIVVVVLFLPATAGSPWPKFRHAAYRDDLAVLDFARSVNRQVYEIIRSRALSADQRNVFLTTFGLISSHSLEWLGAKDGLALNVFGPPNKPLGDLLWILKQREVPAQVVDFVVATEPGAYGVHDFLPSARTAGDLLDAVRNSGEFHEVATINGPDGMRAFVFQREPAFGGWNRANGLSMRHSADPKLPAPVRQFGLWPVTRLFVNAPSPGTGVIEFSVMPARVGTSIRVLVNGTEVQTIPAGEKRIRSNVTLNPNWVSGENCVEFEYTGSAPGPTGTAAVTFTRLRVLAPGAESVIRSESNPSP